MTDENVTTTITWCESGLRVDVEGEVNYIPKKDGFTPMVQIERVPLPTAVLTDNSNKTGPTQWEMDWWVSHKPTLWDKFVDRVKGLFRWM